jgi:hypothetical protein
LLLKGCSCNAAVLTASWTIAAAAAAAAGVAAAFLPTATQNAENECSRA